jgi:dihydrofolate reductase
MTTVTVDMAISLDGYVAGTDITPGNPGGDGAEPLFEWIHELASRRERHGMTGGRENRDSELMRAWFDATGAVVMGRTMYDTGERFWGENPPFRTPVFVLSALDRARAAAGDRNVDIAGGASTVRQYLREGLVDELHLHVSSVLLGAGLRLFEDLGVRRRDLEPVGVVGTALATHLKYRFAR